MFIYFDIAIIIAAVQCNYIDQDPLGKNREMFDYNIRDYDQGSDITLMNDKKAIFLVNTKTKG